MHIKEEIKIFEKEVFKNSDIENYKNYYNFLTNYDENEDIFGDIYLSLSKIKSPKVLSYKRKIVSKIKNLNIIKSFIKVKNYNNLIDFITCVCILKIFSKGSIYDHKDKKILNLYDIANDVANEIEKIYIYIEIKNSIKIESNFNEIGSYIMKILLNLVEFKKINSSLIRTNKKLNKFLFIKNLKIDTQVSLSFEKYNTYNEYIYSTHFSFTNKIFKENLKSGYAFKTKTDTELFKNLTDNWVYIDRKRLEIILEDILIEYNLKDRNIIEEYLNIKSKILEFSKDNSSNLYKKINILQNIIKIKNILKIDLNRKIYLPFIFDFRGRLYYESDISPSFYKEFRYCMNGGKYEKIEEKRHTFNSIINDELKKYFEIIDNMSDYNFKDKNNNVKISIIGILISAGELNKAKIGKEVKIDQFIKEGIKIFKKENLTDYDIFDRIKIKYLKNILEEINNDIYIKWLVSKDATASVYQHLIKACGYKNENALKLCNLKSYDTGYDTYSYIIEEFNKNVKIQELSERELLEIINRKNLKKVIMTENYSASLNTCKRYFLDNIDIEQYNDKKKKEIIKIFEEFYIYISNNKSIFENDISSIIEYFKNNDYILYLNNDSKDTIILKYYKGMKKQKEIVVNCKRYTYQEYSLKKVVDLKKIKTSIKANYIHAMDASLIRGFLSKNKGITIHDCFYIDYINLTYITSCINEGMRIGFHDINKVNTDEIFSIFIII